MSRGFLGVGFKDFVECAGIELPWGQNENLKIVLVYRPPRPPFSEADRDNTAKLCNVMENLQGNVITVGDFNFPSIDWSRNYSSNLGEQAFLDVLAKKFFSQHVNFPTHKDGNLLDLVTGSHPDLVSEVRDEGYLGEPDHTMIWVDVVGPAWNLDSVEMVPDWRKADLDKLKEALVNIDWEAKFEAKSGVDSWAIFRDILKEETDRCVPKMKRRSNTKPVWMNKNILRLIRKKKRLWRWYTTEGGRDFESFQAYKKVQSEVQKSVKNAKKNFEKKIAKDKNKKAFFSYLKKKTSNRVSVGPLKDGDKLVTDNKDMAEMLNNWYLSVFTRENLEEISDAKQLFTGESPLVSVQFTPKKVLEKLKELNPNAAPGPDGIWTKIIYSMAEVICVPLALIYAKCLEEGEVPPEWKTANVAPIFKKGSKSILGNYRPVSLTCVLCKVMEKIICDAIIEYLKLYDLIRRSQHGFMRSRSTLTNLLAYLEELTKIMDAGHSLDVVYLDFLKAFDKVPIQRLLSKCSGLGIQGKLLKWIERWLVGRKQSSPKWRSLILGRDLLWGGPGFLPGPGPLHHVHQRHRWIS